MRIAANPYYARGTDPTDEPRLLRVLLTRADGSQQCILETRFSSYESALREALRLQRQFDEACEPKRAFICDALGVPVAAAGTSLQMQRSRAGGAE